MKRIVSLILLTALLMTCGCWWHEREEHERGGFEHERGGFEHERR